MKKIVCILKGVSHVFSKLGSVANLCSVVNFCRNWNSGAKNAKKCGNFRIFLSLIFYVKSILPNLEVQTLPFWHFDCVVFCAIFEGWNLPNYQNSDFRVSDIEKMAIFELRKSLILISRKIWVAEKSYIKSYISATLRAVELQQWQ